MRSPRSGLIHERYRSAGHESRCAATEALIIALVGGSIGLTPGISAGAVVTTVFGVPLVVSPIVVIGSMLFSMAVGVFFGLYPANKAANLDPIEALRYE